MIALYDFVPSYCPNCGREIDLKGYAGEGEFRYRKDQDFHAHASHFCRGCDLHYQKASRDTMLIAASNSDGDLAEHA